MTEEAVEEVKDAQAVLAELRRAQEDLKSLRADMKSLNDAKAELEAQLESLKSDPYKAKALNAEVKVALKEMGIKNPDRFLTYIKTDELDFDEDGKVTGLSEHLESLKKDLPEVFDPKVRAGGRADIYASDVAEQKMSGTEAQVAHLFNKSA